MKIIQITYLLPFLIVFLSCKKPTETIPPVRTEKIVKKENHNKEVQHSDNLDSIRLQKVLEGALAIAYQNLQKTNFSKKYERIVDSAYSVATEITIGSPFSKQQKHLIIQSKTPIYIDYTIYLIKNDTIKPVITHQQWNMSFINDSIFDINGDTYKDFVINGYGVNGCCLKAFSNVYLSEPEKKSFTSSFRFINPTFSPEEKLVRGVSYGHPGETELYKYAWNDTEIDTLEYLSYEVNSEHIKTGKVIISNGRFYKNDYEIIKLLDKVPTEYHSIYGYNWFTGTILD